MRLFHIPGSRSTRVLWTLEELGVLYDVTLLDRAGKGSAEHRARHPLGRVPVLELDDGTRVFESAAICLHLADLFPAGGLLAAPGTPTRALGYQWTLFAMSELEPAVFALRRARRAEQGEAVAAERLDAILTALDGALRGRAWLLGEAFTVPDVLVGSMLGTVVRRELGAASERLRAYATAADARPANVRAEAIGRPA